MQVFTQFTICRDSIDLIVQCLKYISIFTLILLYFTVSFAVFFWLKAKDDGETTLLTSMGQVGTSMTGGLNFDGEQDTAQTGV